MENLARNRLRIMLEELLDHLEGAQDVASGIAQEYRWRANLKPTTNARATIKRSC